MSEYPVWDWVQRELDRLDVKLEDYPKDRWGHYVLPLQAGTTSRTTPRGGEDATE